MTCQYGAIRASKHAPTFRRLLRQFWHPVRVRTIGVLFCRDESDAAGETDMVDYFGNRRLRLLQDEVIPRNEVVQK
jgi:hypothetical protein